MGTRSVVAIPDGTSWRGRYVHWDGYPEGRIPVLRALVARDGLEVVIKTIITGPHYGWSHLDPEMPPKFDKVPSSEHVAFWEKHGRLPATDPGNGDGRFRCVDGYGVAYTDTKVSTFGAGYQQTTEDDWYTPETLVAGGWTDIEWVYVLAPDRIWFTEPEDAAEPFTTWSSAEYDPEEETND